MCWSLEAPVDEEKYCSDSWPMVLSEAGQMKPPVIICPKVSIPKIVHANALYTFWQSGYQRHGVGSLNGPTFSRNGKSLVKAR